MKKYIAIVAILVFALALRIYYINAYDFSHLEGDAMFYDSMVKQWLETGVYGYNSTTSNAFVPPGFPIILSLVYYIFGENYFNYLVFQSILSVGAVFLSYLISRMYLEKLFSLFVALLCSIYPSFIYANGLLLTEVLFMFTFLLFIYVFLLGFNNNNRFHIIASGAILGFCVLIRATPAYLIVLLFAYYLIISTNKKIVVKSIVYFMLPFIVVMSPWWIRNYILFDAPVLFATSGNNPLLYGVHPYLIGVLETFDKVYALNPDELTRSEMWKEMAVEKFEEGLVLNTEVYVNWFIFGKINLMWLKPWVENGTIALFMQNIRIPMHILIVIGGLIGAVFSVIKTIKPIHVLVIIPIYYTFVHLVYLPLPRYLFPILPFLIILFAFALQILYKKYERKFGNGQ
ncbi:ArnT family glycosyltransferase [Paenibacillus sp. LPE1-1-1.1]|uniref:ArnT family glycosyltransferase n=1 Tax=Paenibacillus sp. LPE1-1-1.1 TaxID=3135230 RepID=UPI0034133099